MPIPGIIASEKLARLFPPELEKTAVTADI